MKEKILFALVLASAMAFAAETKPAEKPKYVDPNPFAGYGAAMRDSAASPFAVGWSQAHDAEIKAATEELTQAFYKVSEKLYAQANPNGGAQPGGDANGAQGAGGAQYYDADYTVVDDK